MNAVDRAALIEAAVAVMVREGGWLAEWHSWRCSYPELYGECDCNREAAAEIVSSVLPLIADAIEVKRAEHFAEYGNEETGPRNYDWALTHAAELVRSFLDGGQS